MVPSSQPPCVFLRPPHCQQSLLVLWPHPSSAPSQLLSPKLTCPPAEVFSHQSLKFILPHIQYSLSSHDFFFPVLEVQHIDLSYYQSPGSPSLPWLFHLVSVVHYFSHFLDKIVNSLSFCPSTLSEFCRSQFMYVHTQPSAQTDPHQSDKLFGGSTH